MLALLADARRDPPHERVEEQQRLAHNLRGVDEVVLAADVSQLVRDDRLGLVFTQAQQQRERHDHDRPYETVAERRAVAGHDRSFEARGYSPQAPPPVGNHG